MSKTKPELRGKLVLIMDRLDDMDYFDSVRSVVGGVMLTEYFMLNNGGWVPFVPGLAEALKDGPIILEYGLTSFDDEARRELKSLLFHAPRRVGITVRGNSAIERVKDEVALLAGRIYYIIDRENSEFDKRFSDDAKAGFAKEARRCSCLGVIMSVGHPKLIRLIRSNVRNGLCIIAAHTAKSELGDGLVNGADYEMVRPEELEKKLR